MAARLGFSHDRDIHLGSIPCNHTADEDLVSEVESAIQQITDAGGTASSSTRSNPNTTQATGFDAEASANGNLLPTDSIIPRPLDYWMAQDFDVQFPWFISENLDIGFLNSAGASTTAELTPRGSMELINRSNTHHPLPRLEHIWYTRIPETAPGISTSPAPSVSEPSHIEIDEVYRRALLKRLNIQPWDQSLPSSDFLNLCVRLYFTRFSHVFPIVHPGTFRPSTANSMLLLSICSVGSLFIGSAGAKTQGMRIFERLNKTMLTTWHHVIAGNASDFIPMIQAAMIGQTFGLLSGDPGHLATVDSFHGTIISWTRRQKIFAACHGPLLLGDLDADGLDLCWKEWAREEERIRIVLGLHIQDTEIAGVFQHESYLRHGAKQLPLAASKALFDASNATDWVGIYRNISSYGTKVHDEPTTFDNAEASCVNNIPPHSRFTIYAALGDLAAVIIEERYYERLDIHAEESFQENLILFYANYLTNLSTFEPYSFGITILWHLTFMALCADFDLLERAVGRDGSPLGPDTVTSIVSWTASPSAKRCVIHALLIKKQLEALPTGFEPAIHVPRATFLAAISWYCFGRYSSVAHFYEVFTANSITLPEMEMMSVNPALLLFEANGFKIMQPDTMELNRSLSGFADLLQRIGHWEIARKFSLILRELIQTETNKD